MKSRSVSVTGATGFVGWRVAEAFREQGWDVRAVVRPGNTKPLPPGVEATPAPLDDVSALGHAVGRSTVIVHCAGIVRAATPAAFDAGNVETTRAVVEAANATGSRLVFISSQAAFGSAPRTAPASEQGDPRPLTPYGRSKLAAETVVRSLARVPWTIVRPSAVYGPRDRGFLPLFRLASRGWFLQVAEPTAYFTLVHVDDLARAISLAAGCDRAAGETLFVGHPQPQCAEDLLRHLAAAFGRPYRPWRMPHVAVQAAAAAGDLAWKLGMKPPIDASRLTEFRAEGFVCDVGRSRDVLGFTAAVPLPEGLARTARWYREQGWI
jgi:nucleoside-diphosphate-sugar epimerase